MGCEKSQLILLLEALERRLDRKMRELGLTREQRMEILSIVEKAKTSILEYGIEEIQRELGI